MNESYWIAQSNTLYPTGYNLRRAWLERGQERTAVCQTQPDTALARPDGRRFQNLGEV